jgi:hypothetical protein
LTKERRSMRVVRLPNNPILYPDPHLDARIGSNLNGPSLIRAPDWLPAPLGRYYLYFAHHKGNSIRLAYADDLRGPWRLHEPGTLHLGESHFVDHIASPDVHVDDARREIRMYYHGEVVPVAAPEFAWGSRQEIAVPGRVQATRVATSTDGLRFQAREEILGKPYFRVFQWDGWHYALGMPGVFYRSRDGLTGFVEGPTCFTGAMRHTAVQLAGETLVVYYTNAGDCPERILRATIRLTDDWHAWEPSAPETVLEPEEEWEGANEPLEPSARGAVIGPARQLRDPAIFEEDGRTFLLYAAAGEYGLAIAEIVE